MYQHPFDAALDLAALPVRERILQVATRLFYASGVRAVGVDTIIAESGVAKASLYRHFPSKDDLVAAYLEQQDRRFWAGWDMIGERTAAAPARDRIVAHLKGVAEYIHSDLYRGCPFLGMAAAHFDADHPGARVCRDHKLEMRRRLEVMAKDAGASDPGALADGLVLLIDGAFGNRQVLGNESASRALVGAGRQLIEAATPAANI